MIAVLIAVRDFLLALAFAWVGVTLDRPSSSATQAQPQQHAQPAQSGASPTAACSAARLCTTGERPHFDALNCDEK